ncbi:hypothetical protein AGLY_009412 [Aphis glycines]|uniref:Uncharacterized protein n=1 Tax=Aphis glycines TaxID=307491 RepID=A0A6G0TJJ8_APHGL|nr:hypothetical protein AGLY_009412 [Aphis glycines]
MSTLKKNKQLSVFLRNFPLKFEVTSVTRFQKKLKTPISILNILLPKSSTEIYSFNSLFLCILVVELSQPAKNIPQYTNYQRFSPHKCTAIYLKDAIIVLNWNANGLKKKKIKKTLQGCLVHHYVDIAHITKMHLSNTYTIKILTVQKYTPWIKLLIHGVWIELLFLSITKSNLYATFVNVYQPPMYMSDYEQIMSLNDLIILAAGRLLNTKHTTNWTCRTARYPRYSIRVVEFDLDRITIKNYNQSISSILLKNNSLFNYIHDSISSTNNRTFHESTKKQHRRAHDKIIETLQIKKNIEFTTQRINTIPPQYTNAKLVIFYSEKKNVFFSIIMLHSSFSPNVISIPNKDLRVKYTLELPSYSALTLKFY